MLQRRFHCFLDWPAFFEARPQDILTNAYLSAPLCNRHGLVAKGHKMTSSRIVHLRHPIRPDAICWGIWTVIVFPFYRIVRPRLFPHVRKEIFKFSPSFAKTDAPPTVQWILMKMRVCRAAFHYFPGSIFRCLFFPLCRTMRRVSLAHQLSTQTPATARRFSSQVIIKHKEKSPTNTNTQGSVASVLPRAFSQNRQSFKGGAGLDGRVYSALSHCEDYSFVGLEPLVMLSTSQRLDSYNSTQIQTVSKAVGCVI